jgi:hypothetical protein
MTEINTGEKLNKAYILRMLCKCLPRSNKEMREVVSEDLITKIERDRAHFITTIESLESAKEITLNSHRFLEDVMAQHEATIESQKEEIEHLKAQITEGLNIETIYREERDETRSYLDIANSQIQSQKEEIRRRVIQAEINISLGQTVINMQSEIESLKAITELAVKGLKEVKQLHGNIREDGKEEDWEYVNL